MLPDEIYRFFFGGKVARVEFRPQKFTIEHQLEGADAKISVLVSGDFQVREMFFQFLSQLLIARPVVSFLAVFNVKFHLSLSGRMRKLASTRIIEEFHREEKEHGSKILESGFPHAGQAAKPPRGLTNSPAQAKKLPDFRRKL